MPTITDRENPDNYIGSRLVSVDCPECGFKGGAAVKGKVIFCECGGNNICPVCGHNYTAEDIAEVDDAD